MKKPFKCKDKKNWIVAMEDEMSFIKTKLGFLLIDQKNKN